MSGTHHTCVVMIRLSEQADDAEETLLVPLIDDLESAVSDAEVGELDGESFDGEWHQVVFFGPDADELHEVIETVLSASVLSKESKLIKRYGAIDDPEAEEIELEY